MVVSNRERVADALESRQAGLTPYVQREMGREFGEGWETRLPATARSLDIAALLRCMWDDWHFVFGPRLGRTGRNYVAELRDVRNAWAHQEPFSVDDAYRALDTAARLLRAISAPQAADVEREMEDIIRIRYERQPDRAETPSPVAPRADVHADRAAAIDDFARPKAATPRPAYPLCECGCGEETGGGRFRPGHDGRLKGRLLRIARAEGEHKDTATCDAAWNRLVELGWSHMFDAQETRRIAEMNRSGAARRSAHAGGRAARPVAANVSMTPQAGIVRRRYPLCECDCGEETAGGRFRPGHDAILKSRLIRTARAEGVDKDDATCEAAWNRLVDLGWSHMFDEDDTRVRAEMNRRRAGFDVRR